GPGGAGSVVGGGDARADPRVPASDLGQVADRGPPDDSARLRSSGRGSRRTITAAQVRPIPGAHPTRAPGGIPTAADDAIVRAEASNTARFALIGRRTVPHVKPNVIQRWLAHAAHRWSKRRSPA